jgi:DNA-directed RNA polymerase subunit M/transcription elongation factor TFIIS
MIPTTRLMENEKLTCKTCGCESLRPMQVVLDEDENEVQQLLGEEQESRFYSCQVCGDNWLTVKEKTADGDCTVTFVHQMGTSPVLKRIAHMDNPLVVSDENVEEWEYYKGDEPVPEEEWHDVLDDRRETLRSTCMN